MYIFVYMCKYVYILHMCVYKIADYIEDMHILFITWEVIKDLRFFQKNIFTKKYLLIFFNILFTY